MTRMMSARITLTRSPTLILPPMTMTRTRTRTLTQTGWPSVPIGDVVTFLNARRATSSSAARPVGVANVNGSGRKNGEPDASAEHGPGLRLPGSLVSVPCC